MSRNKGAANSGVIIARVLGTEGYNGHVHNEVKRWWRRTIQDPRSASRWKRIEKAFSEFMQDADEADRLLVGKFIQLRSTQSFEAGFRIGFQALIFDRTQTVALDDEIEP